MMIPQSVDEPTVHSYIFPAHFVVVVVFVVCFCAFGAVGSEY